jgi:hypothetical protein
MAKCDTTAVSIKKKVFGEMALSKGCTVRTESETAESSEWICNLSGRRPQDQLSKFNIWPRFDNLADYSQGECLESKYCFVLETTNRSMSSRALSSCAQLENKHPNIL